MADGKNEVTNCYGDCNVAWILWSLKPATVAVKVPQQLPGIVYQAGSYEGQI
jgi:hypothetical protein